jgi:hypothetical protein
MFGGVRTPEGEIVPKLAVHVTVCEGEFVPDTVAEQDEVAAVEIVAGEHETVTADTVAGAVEIVIVAAACFVPSAIEVAVSVTVDGLGTFGGAVNVTAAPDALV